MWLSFISFVPLCFVFISEGRKEARASFLKEFEAEKIQHVDSLLACELRGDVQLCFCIPSFIVTDAPALVMRSC